MDINISIIIGVAFSVLFPLLLLVIWKLKTGEKLWCFISGAICFVVFAMILENILHRFCLTGDNAVANAITSSPVLFTLYACFAAGIFEETGRFFGFKVLLKKHRNKECSVAYGIGHGGIEVIILLGITYFMYLLAQLGVSFGDETVNAQIIAAAESIPVSSACIAVFERISAMMIHIGLSMVMFTAVNKRRSFGMYPLAILLHALADAPAALFQYQVIKSIFVVEAAAFAAGLVCIVIGIMSLKNYEYKNSERIEADQ
ncbi:MAG: YhfC family intramembrane metalloprotease [Lachnospiraceae bacterium]|jgi:uncharacterized membrane protein YhfC